MRVVTFAFLAAFTFRQSQPETPHFEVISVKPPAIDTPDIAAGPGVASAFGAPAPRAAKH
jgi:hypothetical protein